MEETGAGKWKRDFMSHAGIDLHSNSNVIGIINDHGGRMLKRKVANDLGAVRAVLDPFAAELHGVVVESTYNWYWLVDGLQQAGYKVHLANTTASRQYSGLKYADDVTDAFWLAEMHRLGVLREGHIYPSEQRAVRDLLRKRSQLVKQRTQNILSIENLTSRNRGVRLSGNQVRQMTVEGVERDYDNEDLALAISSALRVVEVLDAEIGRIEKRVKGRVKLTEPYQLLTTVNGIGEILAMTIMLEAGDMRRFASVGDFSSYCRCVGSEHRSNEKKKGRGNTKNGNRYLSWAFIEAANFAIRHDPVIRRFYQRKSARTKTVVARKAVAHKLARACYYILRDQVPFEVGKCFGH
jgi:transposase